MRLSTQPTSVKRHSDRHLDLKKEKEVASGRHSSKSLCEEQNLLMDLRSLVRERG